MTCVQTVVLKAAELMLNAMMDLSARTINVCLAYPVSVQRTARVIWSAKMDVVTRRRRVLKTAIVKRALSVTQVEGVVCSAVVSTANALKALRARTLSACLHLNVSVMETVLPISNVSTAFVRIRAVGLIMNARTVKFARIIPA